MGPFTLAVAATALFVAVGCSDNKGDSAEDLGTATTEPATEVEASTCGAEEVICVGAVIAPGGVSSDIVVTALEAAEAESDILIEYVEAASAIEFELLIGTMVDREVDLVITAGGGAGQAAAAAGSLHSDLDIVSLAPVPGSVPENVRVIETSDAEAGFLAGALAGLGSSTGKVGAVFASDSDPATAAFKDGWEAGAQFINPSIELFTFFHPGELGESFDDPTWAVSTARDLAAQEVDVVVGWGGTTGNAALVELAKFDGEVGCVGAGIDVWEAVPETQPCLVASADGYVDLERLLSEVIGTFAATGTLPDTSEISTGFTIVGLQSGEVSEDGTEAGGTDLVGQLDEIRAGLSDGTITIE